MLNVLSYGGGVQSTSVLVLARRKIVKIDAVVFIELDTENPSTIKYVNEVARPFCDSLGIDFITAKVSLVRMIEDNPVFPVVPFRDKGGNLFGKRLCTNHGKIRPFRRILRTIMRKSKEKKVNVLYGISADEVWRMRDSDVRYIKNVYPLVDLGMDRAACRDLVASELPVPVKSSCWFCPFASGQFQRNTLRAYPHLVKEAARIQDLIDCHRQKSGLDRLVVLRYDDSQVDMFDNTCGGTCHT